MASNGARRSARITFCVGDGDTGELVGLREAAAIMGVKDPPRISRWRKAGKMPPLVADLACGPVWLRSDVERLAVERRQTLADRATRAAAAVA